MLIALYRWGRGNVFGGLDSSNLWSADGANSLVSRQAFTSSLICRRLESYTHHFASRLFFGSLGKWCFGGGLCGMVLTLRLSDFRCGLRFLRCGFAI